MKKLYDLTQPFHWDLPVYHIYSKPMFGTYHTIREHGFFDRLASFHTHTGTHIDAPRHFCETCYTLDKIPLNKLMGPGVVLDLPKGELEKITAEDLEKAEPKVRRGDIVLINTGWHRNWEKPEYARRFPGIVRGADEWLINCGVKAIGVDWICIDHPSQTDMGDGTWDSHRKILSNNIPVIENLGGEIDDVTGQRVTVIALPVKVVNGDGFPIRVVATLR